MGTNAILDDRKSWPCPPFTEVVSSLFYHALLLMQSRAVIEYFTLQLELICTPGSWWKSNILSKGFGPLIEDDDNEKEKVNCLADAWSLLQFGCTSQHTGG
jgi:hypothetical protein